MSDCQGSATNMNSSCKGQHCPCFTVFLRVLMSYLRKYGDRKSHDVLNHRVKVYTEKIKRQEMDYECLAQTVLEEIPRIVKPNDLRNVQRFLRLRAQLKKQRREQEQGAPKNSVTVRCGLFGILHEASA